MQEIVIKLTPIFLFFLLGTILKKTRIADDENAEFLLKLVFFVALPALVLLRLSQTPLTFDKLYLPLFNIIVNCGCFSTMYAYPQS